MEECNDLLRFLAIFVLCLSIAMVVSTIGAFFFGMSCGKNGCKDDSAGVFQAGDGENDDILQYDGEKSSPYTALDSHIDRALKQFGGGVGVKNLIDPELAGKMPNQAKMDGF